MDYYKFYELYTEYGTLFIYEKYKGEREVFPETREFFTNEKAENGYDQLAFNNGKSVFRTRKRDSEGYIRQEYMKEIQPYEFLNIVEPFMMISGEKENMINRTKEIFDSIAKKSTGQVIVPPSPISVSEKNNVAIQSLKKYIK